MFFFKLWILKKPNLFLNVCWVDDELLKIQMDFLHTRIEVRSQKRAVGEAQVKESRDQRLNPVLDGMPVTFVVLYLLQRG